MDLCISKKNKAAQWNWYVGSQDKVNHNENRRELWEYLFTTKIVFIFQGNGYTDSWCICICLAAHLCFFVGFLGGTSGKESTCQCRRLLREAELIPDLGSSPEGGHGNPLQYSCLRNPMDRGAWWTTVHKVAKSRTWLKWVSIHAYVLCTSVIVHSIS